MAAARAGWSLAKLLSHFREDATAVRVARTAVLTAADAALRLEAVLGEPVSFWLRREAQYREALARRAALKEASAHLEWLRELPLSWMVKQGWVRRLSRKVEQVEECLRFFGVASVTAWRNTCASRLAAFRASMKVEKQLGAVAAWLREAECQAGRMACAPYDKRTFQDALPGLRVLTNETEPAVFLAGMQKICAACGVAVVFIPAPPGCPLHGATRWLTPDKALLALSLRYKTNDQLWFSFFHEAAHLLKHGKKLLFVEGIDGLDETMEEEANRFSANLLVPPADARVLSSLRSIAEVRNLALQMDLAPGILVGRMQREGWIPWSHMNGLKVRYKWMGPA